MTQNFLAGYIGTSLYTIYLFITVQGVIIIYIAIQVIRVIIIVIFYEEGASPFLRELLKCM
jgi:NhaP-type Na+/H+ or K+/H+ antiporter